MFKVEKPLSVLGNIVSPPDFSCAQDQVNTEVWVCGASYLNNPVAIPAGGGIKINFGVIADADCCSKPKIEARADNLNAIQNEPSETNNVARCEILVWKIP
jgi:hypothetical protein